MNPLLLAGIIALAIAATGAYFFGRRKNKALAGILSKEAETALRAQSTEYVNIGGAIGYNFTYKLSEPWTEVKGTMTFMPRQSLLYLPFSSLIGVRDRFFMNLFTKRKLIGEGHILSAAYFKRNGGVIDNLAKLTREDSVIAGQRLVLLYDSPTMASRLKSLSQVLVGLDRLHHFCIFPGNKTIFLYMKPGPGLVSALLESMLPRLGNFLAGKEAKDERNHTSQD
jgi:hypothetical protein